MLSVHNNPMAYPGRRGQGARPPHPVRPRDFFLLGTCLKAKWHDHIIISTQVKVFKI